MKDFKQIIDTWINENTLPYNNPISLATLRIFMQHEKDIDAFNDLTHCKFIKYNDEYRIIPCNGGDFNYFTLPKFDGNNLEYETCFDLLIWELLSVIYEKGDSILEDTIKVNIQDAKDVLKYFNIDYEYNVNIEEEYYNIKDGYYLYEGDGWDDDAEYYFHHSELYEVLKNFCVKYFKYDFAPYTKYNPDFNPFNINLTKLTLDEKIEKASLNDLGKVLADFINIDGLFNNSSDAISFCQNIVNKINDKKLIKTLLLSLESTSILKDKEFFLNSKIEHLLNM